MRNRQLTHNFEKAQSNIETIMYRTYNIENAKLNMKIYSLIFSFFTYPSSKYPLALTFLRSLLPKLKYQELENSVLVCVPLSLKVKAYWSSKSRNVGGSLEVYEGGRRDHILVLLWFSVGSQIWGPAVESLELVSGHKKEKKHSKIMANITSIKINIYARFYLTN